MNLPSLWLVAFLILSGCAVSGERSYPVPTWSPLMPAPRELPRADSYYDYLVAQIELRANQIDPAVDAYSNALKKEPRNPLIMTELATLYVRQGKIDAALKLAEEAAAYDTQYEPAYMLLGQLYAGLGQNRKAIDSYEHVISMDPSNENAYLLLGALYAQEGRFGKAMEVFDRLRVLLPDNPVALYYKARVFLDIKFYDQAESMYEEVLALDPSVVEEFLKLYVAYKAETNFVDVVPQAKRLRLSLNMAFIEINDPKGLCRDISGLGRWGNGDVEVGLATLDELPYVMGLVRQSFERQMGIGNEA